MFTVWSLKIRPCLCKKSIMTLPGVRHAFARTPSWLCEESVTAVRRVHHIVRRSLCQSPQKTESSQSHDGLIIEPCGLLPWLIPCRARRSPCRARYFIMQPARPSEVSLGGVHSYFSTEFKYKLHI